MTVSTKIEFCHRRVQHMDDVTDLVRMLFPGNRNQQYAAAHILMELKMADGLVANMKYMEEKWGISRRTLQRTRAKLAHVGLIERIAWMNTRYHGQEGWKLSTRMSTAMRRLADTFDQWRKDSGDQRHAKDAQLAELLR